MAYTLFASSFFPMSFVFSSAQGPNKPGSKKIGISELEVLPCLFFLKTGFSSFLTGFQLTVLLTLLRIPTSPLNQNWHEC